MHRSAIFYRRQSFDQIKSHLDCCRGDRCWSRPACCACQLILGIFIAFFVFSCPLSWQWSGVINCSIKATLRSPNTVDALPPGVRAVQLRWRTRLLLATDSQHVTLIKRQMALFIQASGMVDTENQDRWNLIKKMQIFINNSNSHRQDSNTVLWGGCNVPSKLLDFPCPLNICVSFQSRG